jgi:hypothetical protein
VYAVAFSSGGIPLIYMGDELAQSKDSGWSRDPAHVHSTAGQLALHAGRIELPPWGFAWPSGR